MQLRKIELLEAVAGKDFFYPRGEHEVPAELARTLISDGLAKAVKNIERNITTKGRKRGVSKTDNSTKL